MEKPFVSVIIRTIGRATLVRSVASAQAQSWRPLEIVVVRAGGEALPPLPSSPDVRVRIVEGGSLTRPQAANAGLRAADGDWLIFLDDDDEYLPNHVETLVGTAMDSGGALVAYSATACIDRDGRIDGVIREPFNRHRLFASNYIQIGAALFSRQLVVEGYRFDESFECLQDWDFWIQLAHRTHFVFTGQVTNRWSLMSGGSGAGGPGNCDAQAMARFKGKLSQKWASWSASIERKVEHHVQASRAAMAEGRAIQAKAHLDTAERVLRGPVQHAKPASHSGATVTRGAGR
ncbi:MAG TPA: glycosyltransferase [Usitatibacter sp.]